MIDKIKSRIKYLDHRISNLEEREELYKGENLTNHGYRTLGRIRGSILSKEFEIEFLESLLEGDE